MTDAALSRQHLADRLAAIDVERDMLLRLIDLYDQWLALSAGPIDTPERVGSRALGSPAPATDAPSQGPERPQGWDEPEKGTPAAAIPAPVARPAVDEVGKTGAAPEVAAPPIEAAPASSLRLSVKDAATIRDAAGRVAGPYPCPHCPRSFKLARHLTHDHEPEPRGLLPVGRAPNTYNGGGRVVAGNKLA